MRARGGAPPVDVHGVREASVGPGSLCSVQGKYSLGCQTEAAAGQEQQLQILVGPASNHSSISRDGLHEIHALLQTVLNVAFTNSDENTGYFPSQTSDGDICPELGGRA